LKQKLFLGACLPASAKDDSKPYQPSCGWQEQEKPAAFQEIFALKKKHCSCVKEKQ
jgi:hypothetical protein